MVGSVLVVVACVGFFLFASRTDADTWVPVLVAINILVIGVLVCRWIAGSPKDSRLFKLVLIGFLLKMAATGPRYYLIEGVYKGEGDAFNYNKAGVLFVSNVTKGDWSIDGSELSAFPRETRVMGYLVGCLYLAFGTTYFGGYLIFALVSWIGTVCFFRAFRIAYPNAPPYLAAKLIFFLPSLVFWPSSPGKEGLMVGVLGLFTLGIARLLHRARPVTGLIEAIVAGTIIVQVRPHLLLIAAIALAVSTLSVREGTEAQRTGSLLRTALIRGTMLLLVVPVLVSSMGRLDTVLGTTGGGTTSIKESLDSTITRTEIGGSAFTAIPVRTPLDLPGSLVTVLFRPFPFEARNFGALIAAAEGMLLLGLAVGASRWIWRIGPVMYRNQFAAFCGTFVVAFVIAFSNIGNAGLLSRQRVQMLPFLLLVACAAKEHERTHTPQISPEDADRARDRPTRPSTLTPAHQPVPDLVPT